LAVARLLRINYAATPGSSAVCRLRRNGLILHVRKFSELDFLKKGQNASQAAQHERKLP